MSTHTLKVTQVISGAAVLFSALSAIASTNSYGTISSFGQIDAYGGTPKPLVFSSASLTNTDSLVLVARYGSGVPLSDSFTQFVIDTDNNPHTGSWGAVGIGYGYEMFFNISGSGYPQLSPWSVNYSGQTVTLTVPSYGMYTAPQSTFRFAALSAQQVSANGSNMGISYYGTGLATPVPEPASSLMLLASIGVLALRRGRHAVLTPLRQEPT